MSDVDELRRAANLLREKANAAPVALALADWLDDEALPGLGRPDNLAAHAVARAVLREAGE